MSGSACPCESVSVRVCPRGAGRWPWALLSASGVIVAVALATQCTRVQIVNTLAQSRRPDLVWPAGTGPPRVRFVASIRSPDDLFVRRKWAGLADIFGGSEDHSFSVPYDVHMGDDDLLLVTDPGKGCVHFMDLRAYRYRAVSEMGNGSLRQPIGVTEDRSGNVYVSDSLLGNVFVFDRQGGFLRPLTRAGTLQRPADLAWSARTGLLYVVDVTAHQVKILKTDGSLVGAIGGRGVEPGKLNFPTHVWVDEQGTIYVTNSLNFSICIFDASGNFLFSFGQEGDTPGYFTRPKGVAADRAGHIYVVDAIFDDFQIFDPRGSLLLAVGESGARDGEFWLPAGCFVDSRNRIFVADQQNHRVEVFEYVGDDTR